VIYNDILAPFRRTKWSEKRGILWNRCIVALIGLFLLFWGLWYKLEGNLWEYLQTTGSIYLASMSVLLIACCYWRLANNWGAIAAIVVGAALPVLALSLNLFIKVPQVDAQGVEVIEGDKIVLEGWAKHYVGDNFVNIGTYVAVAVAMVVGSLLKPVLSPRSADASGNRGDRS
jgi:SSS family solute:Na+ symporter